MDGPPEVKIDLHLHSTCSDGTFTPREVVRRASDAGLSVISLTDHDSTAGIGEAQATGEEVGVEVVPGVELSTLVNERDVHILGYFVDVSSPDLSSCLALYRDERRIRAERIVQKLNAMGVHVRPELVMAKAGNAAVGRPHVADVLVEEGFVFTVDEAFHRYLGYAKPAYQDKYAISPKEAIRVIHASGGLASLAHPGLYTSDDLVETLVADGLDGIEVRHVKHGPKVVSRYTDIVARYGLLATGGSDCHGDGRGEAVIGCVHVPHSYLHDLRAAHEEKLAGRAVLPCEG